MSVIEYTLGRTDSILDASKEKFNELEDKATEKSNTKLNTMKRG